MVNVGKSEGWLQVDTAVGLSDGCAGEVQTVNHFFSLPLTSRQEGKIDRDHFFF